MELTKIPNSREVEWGSAWWEVADLPGVIVYKDSYPAGQLPGWRVEHANSMPGWAGLITGGREPESLHTQSFRVVEKLEGQVFDTRREALQAVEVVLSLIEERE